MIAAALAIVLAYALGSVPVAYLTARATKGIDLRDYGSGNTGASNVFQSVSKRLVVPVGVAQLAQGSLPVLIARSLDGGDGVMAACGIAAVVANNWNPWLGLRGGRGIGATIGVLLVLSPAALAVFIVVSLAGVALKAIPQGVALALGAAPLGAIAMRQPEPIIAMCVLLGAIALAKRVSGNGAPAAGPARGGVLLNRLVYDRDVRDRDAWVRRNVAGAGE